MSSSQPAFPFSKMDMSLDDIVRMECITVPAEYQSIPRGGGGRGRGVAFRGTATYFRRGGYRGGGHPQGRPLTSVSSAALERFHVKRLNTRYGPRGAGHRGGRGSSFYSRADRGAFHRPLLNRPPYTGGFQSGGTVLSVGNLEQGVEEEDIRQLFSVYGQLNHWKLYTNQGGKGHGRAKVIFSHRHEALNAIQHLDSVTLDGRPMCIQMDESGRHQPQPPNVKRGRGGGGGYLGQGTSKQWQDQSVTAEELNREMDEWRMQVDNEEMAMAI